MLETSARCDQPQVTDKKGKYSVRPHRFYNSLIILLFGWLAGQATRAIDFLAILVSPCYQKKDSFSWVLDCSQYGSLSFSLLTLSPFIGLWDSAKILQWGVSISIALNVRDSVDKERSYGEGVDMVIFISKALPEKRRGWEGVLQMCSSECHLDRSRNLEKTSHPAQKITQAWEYLF